METGSDDVFWGRSQNHGHGAQSISGCFGVHTIVSLDQNHETKEAT
jgi:hypothetical protein